MKTTDIRYLIAVSMLAGVGPILARQLIAYFGSAEAVFKESKKNLQKISGIGPVLAESIRNNTALQQADKEIEHAIKRSILICAIHDNAYPERLKNCEDAPLVFFIRGLVILTNKKCLLLWELVMLPNMVKLCVNE
jgi:DNA processing protein